MRHRFYRVVFVSFALECTLFTSVVMSACRCHIEYGPKENGPRVHIPYRIWTPIEFGPGGPFPMGVHFLYVLHRIRTPI